MPLDKPIFPGEAEVNLSLATLTSSGCMSPALAIDDDPATAAVFGAPAGAPGPAPARTCYPGGTVILPVTGGDFPGNGVAGQSSSSEMWDLFYRPGGAPVNFASGDPCSDQQPHGASVVYDPVQNTLTVTMPTLASLRAINPVFAGLDYGTWEVVYDTQPGAVHVTGAGRSAFFQFEPAAAAPRFLRVDWGFDAFVTRIRLDQSGPGTANAGVDFESSLSLAEFGPPPPNNPAAQDVPFLGFMPLPVDGTVHELLVQPPFLANGIVFYPDAFLAAGTPAGSYPTLNLSQLQVYEAIINPGVTPMASQPTVQPARVGVQSLILYPWLTPSSLPLYQAAGNGANLYGLKTLNADATSKLAIVEGGETEHPIGGFGTSRQVKIGFENAKSDLSTFQKVFGGVFTLIPANSNGPEVQYFTENFSDREMYVALVAQSTNGDGNELIVMPKLKVESVSYNLEKDKVTDIKMDFMRFWDYTYTRQDGQIGGIYERTFAASGAAAFHS